MNKENAHLYLAFVQALSCGKKIQTFHEDTWVSIDEIDFSRPPECYRLKPDPNTAWYRVALLQDNEESLPFTATCDSDCNGDDIDSLESGMGSKFCRWLTDRVVYEVPE